MSDEINTFTSMTQALTHYIVAFFLLKLYYSRLNKHSLYKKKHRTCRYFVILPMQALTENIILDLTWLWREFDVNYKPTKYREFNKVKNLKRRLQMSTAHIFKQKSVLLSLVSLLRAPTQNIYLWTVAKEGH